MRSSRHPNRVYAGLIAVVALAVAGCTATSDPAAPTSINIAVPNLGTSNDPFEGGHLVFLPTQATYESLVLRDPAVDTYDLAQRYKPWLAKEWSLSSDGKTMNLVLRDDVDFTDGVHMDAAGVERYLSALFAAENFSNYASFHADGVSVKATGDYTLEISSNRPIDNLFLAQLSFTPIATPNAIDDHASLVDTPVGTGPYLIDEVVPDVSISYVRNPDYWNAEAYPFDELTLTVFSDRVAALNALKAGQVDATALDAENAQSVEAAGLAIQEGYVSQYATLILLDSHGELVPALGDVRVRRAINMAFDRVGITESIELGYGSPSSQPYVAFEPEYVEDGDDRYPFDVEGARALLADAGYADGFDLTIPAPAQAVGGSYSKEYEPIVVQSLADIGIRVTFEGIADEAALFEGIRAGQYPVVMVLMYLQNATGGMRGESGLFAHMLDSAGSALVEASTSGTPAENVDALNDLGEYVLEQAWFAPFSHPHLLWATRSDIEVAVGDGLLRLSSFTLSR